MHLCVSVYVCVYVYVYVSVSVYVYVCVCMCLGVYWWEGEEERGGGGKGGGGGKRRREGKEEGEEGRGGGKGRREGAVNIRLDNTQSWACRLGCVISWDKAPLLATPTSTGAKGEVLLRNSVHTIGKAMM